jgi:thiamine transport system ATP-binding protein
VIEVDRVSVSFDGVQVLDEVSLTADRSEVIAMLGRSGSGKSTLLRVIAGIVPPDSGRVLIDGADVTRVPTHRRGVGMVFQDNQLFPHRDVATNVAFGLKMAGIAPAEQRARTADWLERVGLPGFERRRVTELSGGEAKRIALARTLVTEPSVVLLDEPLTGLDRELHDELVIDLHRLLHESKTTAILVTHDVDEADAIADRVVSIDELTGGQR